MEIIVCIFLIGILIVFSLLIFSRYYLLKKDIRNAIVQCEKIKLMDTNQLIYSKSMDKDVCNLIEEFNINWKDLNTYRQSIRREENEMRNVITNLTHDVRTPVTSMIGYVQLLETEITNQKHKEYLDVISSRAKVLRSLTEELFSYSVLMEESEIKLEKNNITSCLEESLLMFVTEFEANNIKVFVNIEDRPVFAYIDVLALKRVYMNILSNAMKYAQGEITIIQDDTKVTFRNPSSQIDEIDINKLFDRYFTVAKFRKQGSLGLGLYIAKKLVNEMNGKIFAIKEKEDLIIEVKF